MNECGFLREAKCYHNRGLRKNRGMHFGSLYERTLLTLEVRIYV